MMSVQALIFKLRVVFELLFPILSNAIEICHKKMDQFAVTNDSSLLSRT